jgi:hypothetical protein
VPPASQAAQAPVYALYAAGDAGVRAARAVLCRYVTIDYGVPRRFTSSAAPTIARHSADITTPFIISIIMPPPPTIR